MTGKARGIVMMVVAALFASLMALPVSADTTGVGAFTGTAQVGKWFATPCDKAGTGVPTGRGLYLPGTVTVPGSTRGDDTREEEGTWRLSTLGNAAGNTQGGPASGAFQLNVCGWLSATVDADRNDRNDEPTEADAIGASCGTSKGHHGQGNVFFVAVQQRVKLFNVGWKASVGGTLPVIGQYQEYSQDTNDPRSAAKKDKVGQILAQVQAQGGQGCVGLINPLTNNGNGAQTFTVVGVAEFVNSVSGDIKDDSDAIPEPGGAKRCKPNGPPAQIGPDGQKSHQGKPNSTDCNGGEKSA